jgi:hypothetical protein
MIREMAKLVVRVEETKFYGLALGLTKDEVDEVLRAWVRWTSTHPEPIDWPRVQRALVARSLGEEWRP